MSVTTTNNRWHEVRRDQPCSACGKPDWCAWSPDAAILRCMRGGNVPAGMRLMKGDADGGTLFVVGDGDNSNDHALHRRHLNPALKAMPTSTSTATTDLSAVLERLQAKLTDAHMAALVETTHIPADGWARLGPDWCDADDLRALRAGGDGWNDDRGSYPVGAFAFAEYDGRGQLVGFSLRTEDGRKGAASSKATGAKRGLVVPNNLNDLPDPVLCVEGASDVAACVALGLPAVGRPSNRAGAADLADLLDGRAVLVVGERDGKPGGAWPGRDGAKSVAQQVAGRWGESVEWTLPPVGTKDIRAWLKANPQGNAGDLLKVLQETPHNVKPATRTMADTLVDLALQWFRLGVTESSEAFAVARDGPMVALLFRGGASALRSKLATIYRATTGKTPSSSALADALVALEGQAMDADPEPVALRLAKHNGGVVLDLGDVSGRAVVVAPDGWSVAEASPVLFRRTALTGQLPEPADLHDLTALVGLRDLLNVSDDAWPLVVGWLIAACIPNIPHPVLMLGGGAGHRQEHRRTADGGAGGPVAGTTAK